MSHHFPKARGAFCRALAPRFVSRNSFFVAMAFFIFKVHCQPFQDWLIQPVLAYQD